MVTETPPDAPAVAEPTTSEMPNEEPLRATPDRITTSPEFPEVDNPGVASTTDPDVCTPLVDVDAPDVMDTPPPSTVLPPACRNT